MTDPLKQKKPLAEEKAKPPETHAQTERDERAKAPQHHTTEPYGKSSEDAKDKTRSG